MFVLKYILILNAMERVIVSCAHIPARIPTTYSQMTGPLVRQGGVWVRD